MGRPDLTTRTKDWRSKKAIDWVEKTCRIPEGQFVGKPLVMAPFMKDDFKAIFDNPVGTRRAIISRGRKNGKTIEAAIIMLLFLCGPAARPNSQLYSTAQSRAQAAVLFELAAKMVRMSRVLSELCTIRDAAKQIVCPTRGTKYSALSAEVSTSFGLSPSLTIHDELGQVKGPTSRLYEALETATAAQANPLSVIISTQAPTDADLLSLLIDDALTGADPKTVVRLQMAPDDVDMFSVAAIKAANPAYNLFMNKAEVLNMRDAAKRMPSRQAEYENLVCNRRVDAANPFVSRTTWASCGAPVVDDFGGRPVYGGLDLSTVSDLTAFVPIAEVGDVWHVRPTFWQPEHTADGQKNLPIKSRIDHVPYDIWHGQGFLETTPGPTIDFAFIAKFLEGFLQTNNVRKIGYDPWKFDRLKPFLLRLGLPESYFEGDDAIFVSLPQGWKTMGGALDALETAILNGKLAHGNHPILKMCSDNATVVKDENGNRKLSKRKSHGRIDGLQALSLAFSVASTFHAEPDLDIFAMVG